MINTIIQTNDGEMLYLDTTQFKLLIPILQKGSFFHLNMVLDLWGVHLVESMSNSYQLNYLLCNIRTNNRMFFRIGLITDSLGLLFTESFTNEYPALHWFEREIWDLFGVYFVGNSDLRRILTDYGFEGHPLRKDFPVCGYLELKYNALKGKLIYVPIKMTQEYRYYTLENPWI